MRKCESHHFRVNKVQSTFYNIHRASWPDPLLISLAWMLTFYWEKMLSHMLTLSLTLNSLWVPGQVYLFLGTPSKHRHTLTHTPITIYIYIYIFFFFCLNPTIQISPLKNTSSLKPFLILQDQLQHPFFALILDLMLLSLHTSYEVAMWLLIVCLSPAMFWAPEGMDQQCFGASRS